MSSQEDHSDTAHRQCSGSIQNVDVTFPNNTRTTVRYIFDSTRPTEVDHLLIDWDCFMRPSYGPPPRGKSFVNLATMMTFFMKEFQSREEKKIAGCTCCRTKKPREMVFPGRKRQNGLYYYRFCIKHLSPWVVHHLIPLILAKELKQNFEPTATEKDGGDFVIMEYIPTGKLMDSLVSLDLARNVSSSSPGAVNWK